MQEQKELNWKDVMVAERYYNVKYRYNNQEFEETGVFKKYEFGNLYFKCDSGDWIIVKPFNLISATTI